MYAIMRAVSASNAKELYFNDCAGVFLLFVGSKISGCPKSLFVFLKTMFLCVGMELRHE